MKCNWQTESGTVNSPQVWGKKAAKVGEGAYHLFDYSTQEAVIMKPTEGYIPLTEWLAKERP